MDNKRTMLRLLIEEILYNHIDTELSVKLKPIFEALRMIKESEKVRVLKTLIIPNKKVLEGADFDNGASNGSNFEPCCVDFLHLCLHDKDTIEQVKKFLNNTVDSVS